MDPDFEDFRDREEIREMIGGLLWLAAVIAALLIVPLCLIALGLPAAARAAAGLAANAVIAGVVLWIWKVRI